MSSSHHGALRTLKRVKHEEPQTAAWIKQLYAYNGFQHRRRHDPTQHIFELLSEKLKNTEP